METNPFPPPKKRPELEKSIQLRTMKVLKNEGYFVKQTHGNRYQSGVPDLYCYHRIYGPRWLEMKRPEDSRLEDSQLELFAEWEARRVGVWLMTEPDPSILLGPPNWRSFDTGRTIKTKRVERRASSGPERELQEAIKEKLRADDWNCVDLHGNTFSHGFPDMFCCHRTWGSRWIEVKIEPRFTPSQKRVFKELIDVGCPIWVLRSDDVKLLFRKANVEEYSEQLAAPKRPFRS